MRRSHRTCVTHVFLRQSLFELEVPLRQCFLTIIFISGLSLNSHTIRKVYRCLILFAPLYSKSVRKQLRAEKNGPCRHRYATEWDSTLCQSALPLLLQPLGGRLVYVPVLTCGRGTKLFFAGHCEQRAIKYVFWRSQHFLSLFHWHPGQKVNIETIGMIWFLRKCHQSFEGLV